MLPLLSGNIQITIKHNCSTQQSTSDTNVGRSPVDEMEKGQIKNEAQKKQKIALSCNHYNTGFLKHLSTIQGVHLFSATVHQLIPPLITTYDIRHS